MQTSSGNRQLADKFSGCLLGGAVGDAMGRPVEFLSIEDIRESYGADGILNFEETSGAAGVITDDTQMSLFTAEGLLREYRRVHGTGEHPEYAQSVYHAYLRWLYTQREASHDPDFLDCLDGGLMDVPELNHRRAPGTTCLTALIKGRMGTVDRPVNESKGCGGVMRVAPVGLFCAALNNSGDTTMTPRLTFESGCACAAITHGHPLGYLPAGFLAAVIFFLVSGRGLEEAIPATLEILAERPEREKRELAAEVNQALRMKRNKKPGPETVEKLGGGWVGDEALVLSLYCALAAEGDFARGVRLAVNHSGDSDSTGAITGNILGSLSGKGAIPQKWLEEVELANVIEKTALDIVGI